MASVHLLANKRSSSVQAVYQTVTIYKGFAWTASTWTHNKKAYFKTLQITSLNLTTDYVEDDGS